MGTTGLNNLRLGQHACLGCGKTEGISRFSPNSFDIVIECDCGRRTLYKFDDEYPITLPPLNHYSRPVQP